MSIDKILIEQQKLIMMVEELAQRNDSTSKAALAKIYIETTRVLKVLNQSEICQ
jgi:hypothetical protein